MIVVNLSDVIIHAYEQLCMNEHDCFKILKVLNE